MDTEIRLVYATEEDVDAIVEMMTNIYGQMEDQTWFFPDTAEDVRSFITDDGFGIKAMIGDEMAGFFFGYAPGMKRDNMGTYMKFDESDMMKVGHMETAMVDARFRGRGIQKLLMEKAEETFKEMGCVHLLGTAHPDNIFSVNNFYKLGYREVARELKYGGLLRSVFYKNQE